MAAGNLGISVAKYLASVPAIQSLVGTRIYPRVLPQNPSWPAIVYTVVSGESETHLRGSANTATSRVQIDAVSIQHTQSEELAETIRQHLERLYGPMGDDNVDSVIPTTNRYDYEPPKDGSDLGRHVNSRDYLMIHSQPPVQTTIP